MKLQIIFYQEYDTFEENTLLVSFWCFPKHLVPSSQEGIYLKKSSYRFQASEGYL